MVMGSTHKRYDAAALPAQLLPIGSSGIHDAFKPLINPMREYQFDGYYLHAGDEMRLQALSSIGKGRKSASWMSLIGSVQLGQPAVLCKYGDS